MWLRASRIILRNRTLLLVVLALITAFMAFNARKVEMSYEYASLLPKKDSAYIDYQQFLKTFGEEGNLIVVGIHDPNFFKLEKFNAWEQLCQDLSKIEGVENLLSISNSYNLVKDTAARQFRIEPIFPGNSSPKPSSTVLPEFFSHCLSINTCCITRTQAPICLPSQSTKIKCGRRPARNLSWPFKAIVKLLQPKKMYSSIIRAALYPGHQFDPDQK
jgi:hypothetical protein